MNAKAIAALFALVALPVAAQTATPAAPARPAEPQARIQGATTPQAERKDTAKPARAGSKARQSNAKQLAKQKEEGRKRKAPAT